MIGTLDTTKKQITIVGAGISGLLAAYSLDKKGFEVTLIEAEKNVGGLIKTTQTPYGISESAAHSILTSPEVVSFCEELGIQLNTIQPDSKARYICRNHKLQKFPLTFGETVSTVKNMLLRKATAQDDFDNMDLSTWAHKFLGQGPLDYLVAPFVLGVYGASTSNINMRTAFPFLDIQPNKALFSHLWNYRQTKNRNNKSQHRTRMVVPKYGMQNIIEALEKCLFNRLGTRFIKNQKVETLPADYSNLMLCVPTKEASSLVSQVAPDLSQALKQVSYSQIISATVYIKQKDFISPVKGVGVLIPPIENRKILGILFNSSSFKNRVTESNMQSFTVMMGGDINPEVFNLNDDQLKSIITNEMRQILSLKGEPVHFVIHRQPRAIPHYDHHLLQVWNIAKKGWCNKPGNMLFGNYTNKVSIRGMIEEYAT